MGIIIFNGRSSKDLGIEVWSPPNYQVPQRDYDTVHIPGRDGDLLIDKESYKNVSRSYTVSFGQEGKKNFTILANMLAEWLNSASGYARLEDSYEPEYYRLASYQKAVEITNAYQIAGSAAIEFNCKPQRFLKSGDRAVNFVKSKYGIEDSENQSVLDSSRNKIEGFLEPLRCLVNPTSHPSSPIIKVYGNGSGEIQIGNNTITILSVNGYLVIDSDLMEVYKDETNCNSKVKFSLNTFPKLRPGINDISFSGEITSLEVIPKWWTM